jgi:hypothetical protein
MQSGRGRVDDLSGARGFGDGLGNAQILQAVPGADDGFDFPSNHAPEVFDLMR